MRPSAPRHYRCLKKSRPKPRREAFSTLARPSRAAGTFPVVGIGTSAGGLAVVVRDAHDALTVHDLDGRILARGESLPAYPTARLTKDGRQLDVEVTATALIDADGKIYAIATTECAREGHS